MIKRIDNARVFYQGRLQDVQVLFDENEILAVGSHLEDFVPAKKPNAGNNEIPADEAAKQEIEIIDGQGKVLLPGLVDVHVHLREPGYEYKETIATGSKAAARGGFTTIFAMPNVKPFPSSKEVMEAYLKKIDEDACVRVIPFGTITDNERGKTPSDYAGMMECGIRWFSDDGVGVADDGVMEQAMTKAAALNAMFSCHTEDMAYRKPGSSVHEGEYAAQNGWIGIPSACESAQLIRDLDLAAKTGVCYHADHISAKESVEALAKAKAAGADVSAEVTAHHLLLEDKDVKDAMGKMNPPLRSHEDRMALIEGLESGALDLIANDHAPHSMEEKNRPMDKAPFGIVSLETAFGLLYTEFVKKQQRWSLRQLMEWMAEKPAARFGLEKTGKIEPGYRPDFFLADLDADTVIDSSTFLSMGKNTPFDGWPSSVKVLETWSMGKSVWKDKERGTK